MSWLFGGKKEKVDTNKEIQDMNTTIQTLQKREALLIKKIEKEVETAKMYMEKKNKTGF
jgi:hypothetical protein